MKRRKRRRLKKIWVIFLFSLLVIGFVVSVFLFYKDKDVQEISHHKNKEKIVDEESSLSLVMVGDNLIHDKIYKDAYDGKEYNFKKMYSLIKERVSKYDLAYYNQETILGGSEIGLSSYPAFNSPYEVGDAMIDAGFNLVSLATNHTLDRGETAILNSRRYWDSKENIMAVGSYSSFEDRNKIDIRKKNGISYTLLNYTYGTNGISVPKGKEYLVNIWPVSGSNPSSDSKYQSYKEEIKKDIERVRDQVDVLMVAMHWGIEYEYEPNSYQKDMAEFLASLGVDIIIGTHPHVIEPIEWIDNTLVIYSLGNFISAHEVINMGNRVGLMSSLDIVKNNNKIEIKNVKNDLLYTYYRSGYHDFLVVPFSHPDIGNYLDNYQDVCVKYKDIVQKLDQEIEVVSCG